jgi:nucleoside-diphosphate-sugar epimerase
MKIVLPGGAGLVGQNLVARLEGMDAELVVLDKHQANLSKLRQLQPRITAEVVDLADPGGWSDHFRGADVVVMLQAQIGGTNPTAFLRNNITATERILGAMHQHGVGYLVHVSSSVVESVANDDYSTSKKLQEQLVLDSGIAGVVLRPTLMFGWFDRKHLGWLSRFMQRVPVFPIPGDGRFMRQPLYAGDFCDIIISCFRQRIPSGVFNISGQERVDYIDMIREIKRATRARARVQPIPYSLFYALLWLWGLFDKDPPFTTTQLKALTAHDEFEVIDWPTTFGVAATPFNQAIAETFEHPTYSRVELEF